MATNRRAKPDPPAGQGSRETTTIEVSRATLTNLHALRAGLGYPTLAAALDGEAGRLLADRAREVMDALQMPRPEKKSA